MKSSTQVVVIGGGVVGASVLYHLTEAGWTDVVLVERKELTAGSTWHSAGGMHTLNGDPNVSKLQQYTIELYQQIEARSEQNCSIHLPGGLMLADDRERLDWLRMAQARGRYLGMELEIITPSEAKALFPLLEEQYFVGALFDPVEGHLDPSGVTNAYAICARQKGAEVYRHTWVSDLRQRPDGTWDVITDQGEIHAEHIVNAGGLWAREVGRMVGLELPVLGMEHMYLVTEDMEEVADHRAATGRELPMALDFAGEIYIRQEGGGMLLGTYEQACVPWQPQQAPWSFDMELLEPDLDRIAPSLEIAFKHYPAMATAGIKRIINGPFTFAPDGNPLVGPIRGVRNCWVACAVMAGLSQGGGVGLALANWMTTGDPQLDIWAMDVARFGDWATLGYTNAKVRENYSRRFRITFPNEELPAAPPAAHDADLRPADRAQRRVGRRLRARASAVVPTAEARTGRGRDVPPLERVPGRRRGVPGRPRAGRVDGVLELRQVPRHRRRRGGSGCRDCSRTGCRRSAASCSPPCSTPTGGSSASSRWPGRARTSSSCSGRRSPRSTTPGGSSLTCRPAHRCGSRCSRCRSSGCRSPARMLATSCSR